MPPPKSRIFGLFLSSCLLLTACGKNSGNSVHSENVHSHSVADIEPGIWPPKLANIENEELIPQPTRRRGSNVVIKGARASVLNNPNVRSLLGNNYGEYEASESDAKSGIVASFLFYNYDSNNTVDVKLSSDGSVRYEVFPPTVYQPTENPAEIQQAIELATSRFGSDGVDVSGLQGTAMLAFVPEDLLDNDASGHFYPERVLYVTFGSGNGEEPLYRAVVNLSQQSVIENGEIL